MVLALGRLRIAPRVFWSLTVPELDAILHGALALPSHSVPALDRSALDALRARYPD